MMNQIQCEMLGVCVCECVCFLAGHFRIQLKKATKGMKRKKNRHTESKVEKKRETHMENFKTRIRWMHRHICSDHLSIHWTKRKREKVNERLANIESQDENGFIILYFIFIFIRCYWCCYCCCCFLLMANFQKPKNWLNCRCFNFNSFNHFKWISNKFRHNVMLHILFYSLFSLSQFAVCVWTKEWIKKAHTPQLKMYNCNVLAVVNQSFWCMKSAEWRKWEKIRRLTPYINIIANRNVNLRLWYCIVFSAKLRLKSHSGTLWLMLSSLILRYKF